MPSFHPDFQKYNFNRLPSWRFDRAWRLVDERSQLDPRKDDDLTLRAVKYLRAVGSRRCLEGFSKALFRCHPELHAAHWLRDHGGELCWELEARLLARQTSQQIAQALSLDPAVIDAYEGCFFCVRDRLNTSDWIAGKVIGPGPRYGFVNDVPGLWKAVAYAGGPLPLEVVMACTSITPGRARFTEDLMRRARRLVDVLMLPADASPDQVVALHEELGAPLGETARTRTSPQSSLDEIVALAAEQAATDVPAPCARPELGKTANRGATRVAA